MEKLEQRIVEHRIPIEDGQFEIFETKEWNIEDIANKVNEIIELINEITKK